MIGNDPRYQAIIDAYKSGEYNAPYQAIDYSPSPYYNPIYDIRREQIKAGELPEGARFPKPLIDTAPKEEEKKEEQFDPCPPGYQLVDGVCQPDTMFQGGGDGEYQGPEIDKAKAAVEKMKKDPTIGYGASSILDDYITEGIGKGTFLSFDPSIGRLGAGSLSPFMNIGGAILDPLLGLPKRREDLYNKAIDFMLKNQYGKKLGEDIFKVFSPQEYYNQVMKDQVTKDILVGQAVEQMVKNQGSEGGGAPIAKDLSGGLLYTQPLTKEDSSGNRTRDDSAYRAALARNVKANPTKFRSDVGGTGRAGFIGGR